MFPALRQRNRLFFPWLSAVKHLSHITRAVGRFIQLCSSHHYDKLIFILQLGNQWRLWWLSRVHEGSTCRNEMLLLPLITSSRLSVHVCVKGYMCVCVWSNTALYVCRVFMCKHLYTCVLCKGVGCLCGGDGSPVDCGIPVALNFGSMLDCGQSSKMSELPLLALNTHTNILWGVSSSDAINPEQQATDNIQILNIKLSALQDVYSEYKKLNYESHLSARKRWGGRRQGSV